MSDIVLITINARYSHTAVGLRCLYAQMGALQAQTTLLEFDLTRPTIEIAEQVLNQHPRIVGLGVYIWNVEALTQLAVLIKQLAPDIHLVAGGPEISHETEQQPLADIVDVVIAGEADRAFAAHCQTVLSGAISAQRVILAETPDLSDLEMPYAFYSDEDVRQRVIYVEASRGCPFGCDFCLSALDRRIRVFPLDRLLPAFSRLLDRGVQEFKFLDRTFNTSPAFYRPLFDFFLDHYRPGLFLHLEMVPDRFPDELKEILKRFPPGTLQLEVGVQTFNPAVAARIHRRGDMQRTADHLRWLREETGAHVHADLIVGLPGEDRESFGRGFDELLQLRPHEIQVNLLKRLRGTPLTHYAEEWGLRFHREAPYEILCSRHIDFFTMQQVRRFARYWDLYGNSGRFPRTLPLLWSEKDASPFDRLWNFFQRLYARHGQTHKLALEFLAECLWDELCAHTPVSPETIACALALDYTQDGQRRLPVFLRTQVPAAWSQPALKTVSCDGSPRLKRQHRQQ